VVRIRIPACLARNPPIRRRPSCLMFAYTSLAPLPLVAVTMLPQRKCSGTATLLHRTVLVTAVVKEAGVWENERSRMIHEVCDTYHKSNVPVKNGPSDGMSGVVHPFVASTTVRASTTPLDVCTTTCMSVSSMDTTEHSRTIATGEGASCRTAQRARPLTTCVCMCVYVCVCV
jgi:hypothetical protein